MCDDNWDLVDATVVCRQLGFTGAIGATKNSFFDRGNYNDVPDSLYVISDTLIQLVLVYR